MKLEQGDKEDIRNGDLEAEKNETIMEVVKRVVKSGVQRDAFFVADGQQLVENVAKWSANLPSVTPVHDISVNASPWLMNVLAEEFGAKFLCRSRQEVDYAINNNIKPIDVVFGQCGPIISSHLKHAAANDVGLVAFDSVADLKKIRKFAPQSKLMLAVRPTCGNSDNNMWLDMLATCKEFDLKIAGVAFGSVDGEKIDINKMMAFARAVFVVGASLGHDMEFVDVGPINFGSNMDADSKMLNDAFAKHFGGRSGEKVPKVFAHIPESVMESTFVLATRVIGKRLANNSEQTLIVDEGIFGAFRRLLVSESAKFSPMSLDGRSRRVATKIFGPSGDDFDVLADNCKLEASADWIVFDNMGSFSIGVDTDFVSLPLPTSRGKFWFFTRRQACEPVSGAKKFQVEFCDEVQSEPFVVVLNVASEADEMARRVELFRQLPQIGENLDGLLTNIN